MRLLGKKIPRRNGEGERGQAMIEFLVVIFIVITMIFLFVQVAWGIAFGHYVHYTTFIAARAYLSAGQTKTDQRDAAETILQKMLKQGGGKDLFAFIAKARGADTRDAQGPEPITGAMVGTHPTASGKEKSRAYSWAEGVQYNYALNLFLLPLSGSIAKEGYGESITGGPPDNPTKAIEWQGTIPFTSDSFLGREPTYEECNVEMTELGTRGGIGRADGIPFLEDNGC